MVKVACAFSILTVSKTYISMLMVIFSVSLEKCITLTCYPFNMFLKKKKIIKYVTLNRGCALGQLYVKYVFNSYNINP